MYDPAYLSLLLYCCTVLHPQLFYLIQRVRLALDRGRAGDSKAAPHADSGVSSSSAAATAAAEKRDGEHVAAGSAESRGGDDASSSVRFRQELEVPAQRDMGGPRVASPRTTTAGGSGAGGWRTPAKVQRLPPSHRRPKTPHVDGTAAGTLRHPAGTSKTSALVGEGGRRAEDKHPGGLATSVGGGGAILSPSHTNGNRGFQRDQLGGGGGGGSRAPAATPERSRSERSIGKKSLEQRKVLVPVQLGEVEERARPSATRGLGLPPPPSPRRLAPRTFGGKTGSTADSRLRPAGGGQGHREAARGGPTGAKCPPSPSAGGDHSRARGFDTKRQAADGNRGLRRKNSATALPPPSAGSAGEASAPVEFTPARRKTGTAAATTPSRGGGEANALTASVAAVAAAPPTRTQEVAHLRPPKREASAGGGGAEGGLVKPRGLDDQGRNAEVPQASRGGNGEGLLDSNEMAVSTAVPPPPPPAAAAAAASAAESERGTAAELAVHLISAHREDVRSALAAARRDMDLVSKADQDRQPAALLEYAKEVEGVLGVRLAAGAKLRAALDSYVALRQASSGPGQECGLPEGRARGVRTVQA